MLKIIKANLAFFAPFLLFLVIGGILLTIIEQGEVIHYFSAHRTSFGDYFFGFFTKLGEEPIYIIFFSLFIFIRFRYAILIPLTGVLALCLSYILKLIFSHPRPFRFFTENGTLDQLNLVEGIDLFKGMTSFPSGHTMSAFAVFSLVAFLFSKKPYIGPLMFFFALVIGLSRIYLVQHFMEDVYLGAILGVILAMIIFWFQDRYPFNDKIWIDRSLLSKKKSPHV